MRLLGGIMRKFLCLVAILMLFGSVAWGQEGGTISGTVFTEDGGMMVPLPFAHVAAFPPDSEHPTDGGLTDTSGHYVLHVPQGDYVVKAEKMNFVPEWYDNVFHRSEATVVHVTADNSPTGIDFILGHEEREGGLISGRIIEEGTDHGIGFANVRALRVVGEPLELNAHSVWNGYYAFPHLPPGGYVVEAWKEGWSHGVFPETLNVDNNEINDVNIFLHRENPPPGGGSISGVITNGVTDEPLEGAYVVANGHDRMHHFATQSGPDGAYSFPNLPSDRYFVHAFKLGFFPGEYPDMVPVDSGDVTGIDIPLVPFQELGIAGVVTDAATNAPIAGAMVFATNVDHSWMHSSARTGDDGHYLIHTLPGEYIVEASAMGFWRQEYPTHVVVSDGVVEGINFALTAIDFGSIAGFVTDSAGAPVPGAVVVARKRGGRFESHTRTDSTGAYLLDDIIPGTYRVLAFHRDFAPGAYPDSVVVADGQDVTGINIVLGTMQPPFDGSITGVVTDDSTGAPLSHAFVMAIGRIERDGMRRWIHRYEFTGEDGSYQFTNLPTTEFRIFAAARGYLGEFYDNVRRFSEATPVTPNADGINFALSHGRMGPRVVAGRIIVQQGFDSDGFIVFAVSDGEILGMVAADPLGFYSFDDIEAGTYEIMVSSVQGDGELGYPLEVILNDVDNADIQFNPTSVDDDVRQLPVQTSLAQNYPNPFNAQTMISFDLASPGHVELSVYNIVGQKVVTLASGEYQAGRYNVIWDGRDPSGNPVTSGVYYYRLKAGENVETMKMTLLK